MKSESNDRSPAHVEVNAADEYSAVNTSAPRRRELIRAKQQSDRRARPFIVLAVVILLGVAGYAAYGYYDRYVEPPKRTALRVGEVEYSLGDVVNFIRFNQRLAEDIGQQFDIGNSLFEALEIIQNNEIAFRSAPSLGVTVTEEELNARAETILGFPGLTPEERVDLEIVRDLAEAERQLLNRIGLSREVYLDILRRSLFKEQLREVVAADVPRIQPQVHVYEIVLASADPQTLQRIERALTGGDLPGEVALAYSTDPNVQRNRGDVGWLPVRVVPEIDNLLWGIKDDGSRVLPVGAPSQPQFNADAKTYNVYIVAEISEAREITDTVFQKLADVALDDYINARRNEYSGRNELFMSLDNTIYDWVNRQVRLASLLPTPTAQANAIQQLTGQ